MNHLDLYPTIFESFNARALEPEQVAKTFVPPDGFDAALTRSHTLIVGPRGSGKTTILKMMQSPALEAWIDPLAEKYRKKVDFTGVFIPADRSWSEQIAAVGEDKLSLQHKNVLGVSAFTTHVLRALIEAMQYKVHAPSDPKLVPHRRAILTRKQESTLVGDIASKWYLTLKIPSLIALKQALTARLSEIWEIGSSESLRDSEGRGQRLSEFKFLQMNFLTSAEIAIEYFDDITSDRVGKWGLLFDELELAPVSVREQLMKSLRSVSKKFLFKLSMSPFSRDAGYLDGELSATLGNDYNQVALWYAYKESGYAFSEALFASLLKDYGIDFISPERLLGRNRLDSLIDSSERPVPSYYPGSRDQERFLAVSKTDHSFRRFLDKKGLDLNALHNLSEDERAAEIRKIKALVAIREAYRVSDKKDDSRQQKRGRKSKGFYRGARSLFTIVEGNPRWFISIIGKLIRDYANEHRPITTARQSEEVEKATNRFRAFLKTVPCPVLHKNQKPRGVLSILDIIGKSFSDGVIKEDFSADPALTFIVDARTNDNLMQSLGRALNAGAIVYLDGRGHDLLLEDIRGKRFRISYLLAPHYKLPLILGRSVSLKSIILKADKFDQNTLFPEESEE